MSSAASSTPPDPPPFLVFSHPMVLGLWFVCPFVVEDTEMFFCYFVKDVR